MERVSIDTPFIKLDSLLKYAALVSSGAEAKWLIKDGMVRLNGEVVTQRSKKCYPGDVIKLEEHEVIIVDDEK